MNKMMKELKKRIREIPGDADGWTKGDERLMEIAEEMLELVELGASEDVTLMWTSMIHWETAGMYGA